MSVTIRKASRRDVPAIQEVEMASRALYRDVEGLEFVAGDSRVLPGEAMEQLAEDGRIFLADKGGRVAGFLCATPMDTSLHIWGAAVAPHFGRSGIGRSLFEAAEGHARSLGLGSLTVTAFREVPWNEPFLESLGYMTLDDALLDERLRHTLDAEAQSGLPRERRVAMMKVLPRRGG
ncbi:GNAT family N-acetyltransferase [Phaeovibrio sulfidiphilus]|uniref:GNAT family N-acetyltransferase n=1 Tax=Phaeovibrio sulfidiphilus TaxID=1220600 RepID=A0A8J6YVA7_9PROT|nr:GNAT family N-acetyltransferase [Phaeovibrio sulfidiphilus]MBE1236402.1 GNAT family N-acetyltransferase [Phaeovibrio sulfidiphilus]